MLSPIMPKWFLHDIIFLCLTVQCRLAKMIMLSLPSNVNDTKSNLFFFQRSCVEAVKYGM